MHIPILEIFIIVLTINVIVYGAICLPTIKLKLLFVGSVILLSIYKLYDPVQDSNVDDIALVWFRHLFFYMGELLFYLFIGEFSHQFIEREAPVARPKRINLGFVPIQIAGTTIPWFQLLTDQGLPHVFALPLFVLVVSLIRLRLAVYASPYVRIATLFSLAVGAMVMIHVSEFVVESQKFFPALEDNMANIEFGWFLISISIFIFATYSFKQLYHAKTA